MIKKNNFKSKFENTKISSAFFTRNSGFSFNNYSTLNCSYSGGDQNIAVKKNIELAQKILELDNKKLKLISQIHSNNVVNINNNNYSTIFKADGMITQDKNISLAVLTADCSPIFIFDQDATFIACLHSGWKGCYLNIIDKALLLIKKIQPNLDKINVIIGPCLNQKNFEVTKDFKKKFISADSNYQYFFLDINEKSESLFNMRGLIEYQFKKNMVTNIENIDIDTYENKELFYSHRRSTHNNSLPTGRMINIIGFNN